MALSVKVGQFATNGTATIAVTGVGFTPKALLVWGSAISAASDTFEANSLLVLGMATRRGGTTQEKSAFFAYTDNVATSSAIYGYKDALYWQSATSETLTLSSFDADGFTLASANSTTGIDIGYMAIGGSDLTDACVVEDDWPTAGATFDVIGAGFTPDCGIFISGPTAALSSGTASLSAADICLGVFAGAAQWSLAMTGSDADTMTSTMNNNSVFSADSCLTLFGNNSDTVDAKGIFSAFTSDGATITNTNAPTAALRVFALYLQGGQYKAGSKAKASTAIADSFTFNTPTFTPEGVLLAVGAGVTSNTVVAATQEMSVGGASAVDGSAEGYAGATHVESINTTADSIISNTKAIAELTPGASPAVDAAGDMTAFGSGSFELTWDATGTAALVGFLAMGDTAVVATPPNIDDEGAYWAAISAAFVAQIADGDAGVFTAILAAQEGERIPYNPALPTFTISAAATFTATLSAAGAIFDAWHHDVIAWQIPPPEIGSAILSALLADEQALREVLPVSSAPLTASITGTSSVTATLTSAGTNVDVSAETSFVELIPPPPAGPSLEAVSVAAEVLPVGQASLSAAITGTSTVSATLTAAGTSVDVDSDTAFVQFLPPDSDPFTPAQAAAEAIPVDGTVAVVDSAPLEDDSADWAQENVPAPDWIIQPEHEPPVGQASLTATITGTASVTATLTSAGTNLDTAAESTIQEHVPPPPWVIHPEHELPVSAAQLTGTITGTSSLTATLTSAGTSVEVGDDTAWVALLPPDSDPFTPAHAAAQGEVIPTEGTPEPPGDAPPTEDDSAEIAEYVPPPAWIIHPEHELPVGMKDDLTASITGTASLTATLTASGTNLDVQPDTAFLQDVPPVPADTALVASEEAREVLPVGQAALTAAITGTATLTATLGVAGTNVDVSGDTEHLLSLSAPNEALTAILAAQEQIPVDGAVQPSAPLEDDSWVAGHVPPDPFIVHDTPELPVSSGALTATITGTASLTATLLAAGATLDASSETEHVLSLSAFTEGLTAVLMAAEGEVLPVDGLPGDAPPGMDDSADVALHVPPPPHIIHAEHELPVSAKTLTASVTGTSTLTATLTVLGTTVDVDADTAFAQAIPPTSPVPAVLAIEQIEREQLDVNPKALSGTITGTSSLTATLTVSAFIPEPEQDTAVAAFIPPFTDATVAQLSAIADTESIPVDGTITVTRWVVGSARYTVRDVGKGRYVTTVVGSARYTTHDSGRARLEAESL